MEWLTTQLNGENGSAISLILITLALAILLIVIVWVFRKISGSAARRSMRSRVPRLSITDSATVDDKRYLVMVRRDNVEHLLLIGGANDLVVESNIMRASSPQKPATTSQVAQPQPAAEEKLELDNVEQEPTNEKTALGLGAIAATASAGVAGVSSMTSRATAAAKSDSDTIVDSASDVAAGTTDLASNAVESVSDGLSSVTETVADKVTNTASTVTETVSASIVEPEVELGEPEIDLNETEVIQTAQAIEHPSPQVEAKGVEANFTENEIDLESTISAKLDDALSAENIEIDISDEISLDGAETVNADVEANVDPNKNNDDEMQRLLDELSGETKEKA